MNTLQLRGEHITLAQAVKAAGFAGSGGQAKHLVRSGAVTVNGTAEIQPGRKLTAGDRFVVDGGDEWTIESLSPAGSEGELSSHPSPPAPLPQGEKGA